MVTCCKTNGLCPGVVYEINKDKWGHANQVLIHFHANTPDDYSARNGYAGANIYNLRDKFKIFREGQEIK